METSLEHVPGDDLVTDEASDETVEPALFDDLPTELRLRLAIIARASADIEAALPFAVRALVGADDAKCTAITSAIASNDALRAQWVSAWRTLRGEDTTM